MTQILKLIAKARTVAASAVPYILAISTTITVFADELVGVLPDQYDGTVTEWAARIVAFLAGVVAVIRRVTPVPPKERGVLPASHRP